jgi:glycosyltransferase involved in cell wall biosynthesis
MKVAYVYANPRRALAADVAAGRAPDTGLLGQNHLAHLGIEAVIHEPALRRRQRQHGLLHRLTWNARELTAPWEVRGADVICTPLAALLPLSARVRRRPRVVVLNMSLCTTYDRSSAPRRRLLQTSLASAAAVVCFAEEQRQRLVTQTGLSRGRVHVVPLGVDERFYVPSPLPSDGHILAVGRDLARDYRTFGVAVAGLQGRVVLVASERNLRGVPLPDNVEVRLDVSYGELRDLYRGARCVIIPTRSEGYPYGADCSGQTVLLDAMASARPVVISARATLTGYVRDGEQALIVPPEDPAALRSAIARVLDHDSLARSLAVEGRRAVDARFSTVQLAKRLADIIHGTRAS